MKIKKTLVGLLLATMCAGSLSGCGDKKEYNPSDDMELHEPVNASANTEKVQCRDIRKSNTYVGTVYPEVIEYSFSKAVTIDEIHYFLGEKVHKGDVLVTADDTQVVNQIEALEEQIKQMDKNYEEQMQDYDTSIAEQKKNLKPKKDMEQFADFNPGLQYQIDTMEMNLANTERQKKDASDLYEYDRAYYVKKLNRLRQDAKVLRIVAEEDGVVVKLAETNVGDNIAEGNGVIGVSSGDEKYFKCEYLSEKKLNKAARYYLMVNGEKYDVTYIPYAAGEYDVLTAKGEATWSKFAINDPDNKVQFGDAALLCVIEQEERGCVSVPTNSIHRDEAGAYVFVVNGDENRKVYVERGISDGAYTQALSGVKEGDNILLSEYNALGGNTVTLKKGDFVNSYSGSGEMSFPEYTVVTNDVEYGEVRFLSFEVQMLQQVKKGDVIATIEVTGDQVVLSQKKRELSRLQERRQDLVDSLNDPEVKRSGSEITQLNRRIANYDEQIADQQKEIKKIQASYSTTTIKATADGLVAGMAFRRDGEVLRKNDYLVVIASTDPCYISTKNTNQVLNYGNKITLTYTDENKASHTMEGTVVSAAAATVSKSMSSEYAYIAFDPEELMKLSPTQNAAFGGYYQMAQYELSGTQRSMNNVVLVPRKAVKVIEGQPYVCVKTANGDVINKSFISGGSNTEYYWVMEGLEEGDVLCLE